MHFSDFNFFYNLFINEFGIDQVKILIAKLLLKKKMRKTLSKSSNVCGNKMTPWISECR